MSRFASMGPLFAGRDEPALRRDAACTSVHAASLVAPKVAGYRARVLAAIAAAGERGMTREEAERATGLSGNTVRPRWIELRDGRLIRATGTTRPTSSGSRAEVWVATTLGQETAHAAGATG